MSKVLDDYKQAVAALRKEAAGPLTARLAELNEEIPKVEERAKMLRAERTDIMAELRRIDPALAPSLYEGRSKNGKKEQKKPASPPSPQMLERLENWIREHPEINALNEGLGFRPTDLYTRDDFDVIKSESAVNKSLDLLRQEGKLRLAKWERGRPQPGRPTGKFYKTLL